MTFPLLRLPLLASIKVINQIDIKKLISFIHLSKRAKILVKRSKVPIELTVFKSCIQFRKLANLEMVENVEFPNHITKPFKKLMDDFVEFFKVRSVSFELERVGSYNSLFYMEYAESLGLKFTTARVFIGGSRERVYQSLLKVCSNASQLMLWFDTDEVFTFDGFKDYRMNTFRFSTNNLLVKWFTADYMCALVDCLEVSILDENWTDADINRFLRFWMTSDGRLQSLDLGKRYWHFSIDPQVVLNGIDNRQLEDQKFEIQRADEVKAKVACYDWRFTLEVIDA